MDYNNHNNILHIMGLILEMDLLKNLVFKVMLIINMVELL